MDYQRTTKDRRIACPWLIKRFNDEYDRNNLKEEKNASPHIWSVLRRNP